MILFTHSKVISYLNNTEETGFSYQVLVRQTSSIMNCQTASKQEAMQS